MPSPQCCTFDPVSKVLAMAGQGSGKSGPVCLALWQLTDGNAPIIMGRYGQPAKQSFFGRPKDSSQAWVVSLDVQSRMCLVAPPGSQLHLFRWKVCVFFSRQMKMVPPSACSLLHHPVLGMMNQYAAYRQAQKGLTSYLAFKHTRDLHSPGAPRLSCRVFSV